MSCCRKLRYEHRRAVIISVSYNTTLKAWDAHSRDCLVGLRREGVALTEEECQLADILLEKKKFWAKKSLN